MNCPFVLWKRAEITECLWNFQSQIQRSSAEDVSSLNHSSFLGSFLNHRHAQLCGCLLCFLLLSFSLKVNFRSFFLLLSDENYFCSRDTKDIVVCAILYWGHSYLMCPMHVLQRLKPLLQDPSGTVLLEICKADMCSSVSTFAENTCKLGLPCFIPS